MATQDKVSGLVDVLKKAKNDTEKFAALLLVTKALRADSCTQLERRALFDAVGFDFLSRLLHTNDVPLGCPSYIYKSVALSILSAFSTDAELCTSSRMLVNIPVFLDLLDQQDDCELPLQADAYQLLRTIVTYERGVEAMVQYSALEKLSGMLESSDFQSTKLFPLFVTLVRFKVASSPPDYPASFKDFIVKLSLRFRNERGELKFKLCSFLYEALSALNCYDFPDDSWKTNIHCGLYEILSSRINIECRNEGLTLFSVMVESYGFLKIKDESSPEMSNLTALAVNLSCVELRMKLEDRDLDAVVAAGVGVVTNYSILEHAIKELLLEDAHQDKKIQLYSAIKGAAAAVIDFLSRVWKETGEQWCDLGDAKLMVIFASLRVLAAWLAEETEAWRQEVYEILPFLIAAAKQPDTFNSAIKSCHKREEACPKESISGMVSQKPTYQSILRYLLPSFCHFSSETVSLNIMFEHNVPELLLQEFKKQSIRLNTVESNDKQDSEMALITIGGVFMNMIVLRSDDCRTLPVFSSLLDFCMKFALMLSESGEDICESDNFILLQGHLCVMGLMLLQNYLRQVSDKTSHPLFVQFIKVCITFLAGAHICEEVDISNRLTVAPPYRRHWDSLMDLWFLGMQCLETLVVKVPLVGDRIWETFWLQNILSNVTPGCLEGNQRCAFDSLLATLAKHTATVASKLNNSHIKILCDVHGLQELKKVICEPSTTAALASFEV